jgi:hypothetical protein
MTVVKRTPATEALEATSPFEWDTSAPFFLRLVLVRNEIRDLALWRRFDPGADGGYDAFSIHILAREIESVLNARGLFSEFRSTKWHRANITTIVDGEFRIVCADTGEERSYPVCGEGADNYDKGMNKAISCARKNGFIQAFQLALGRDIETENVAAGGAATAGKEFKWAGPVTAQSGPEHTYSIDFLNDKRVEVYHSEMVTRFGGLMVGLENEGAVNELLNINTEQLRAFQARNPEGAIKIRQLADARIQVLQDRINKARAA